jgi:hypothetical protein
MVQQARRPDSIPGDFRFGAKPQIVVSQGGFATRCCRMSEIRTEKKRFSRLMSPFWYAATHSERHSVAFFEASGSIRRQERLVDENRSLFQNFLVRTSYEI